MKSTVFDLGQFPTTFLITQKPQGWPTTVLHPLASAEAIPPQASSSGTNRKDCHLPLGTPSWKSDTTSAKLSIMWRENVCSMSEGNHHTEWSREKAEKEEEKMMRARKERSWGRGEGSVKRVKGRPFGIVCCLTQSCQTPVSRHPF